MADHSGNPRVLYLIPNYPPAFGGGAALLKAIRTGTAEAGLRSLVVTGHRGIPGGGGERIYRLPSPFSPRWPRLDAYLFALLSPWMLFLLAPRYDLIHTMGNAHHVYAAVLVGRILGKPVIIASQQNRGDDPGGIRNERFGSLKNAIFSRADRFVCCSGYQVEVYARCGYPEEKVRFIPNCMDPARFRSRPDPAEKAALRRRLGVAEERLTVVSIGAIIHRKGTDLLLEGWRRFLESGRKGTLVLVGPNHPEDPGGDVEADFVRQIQERSAGPGIAGTVVLTGRVGNVEEYLGAADVFALMSRGEGFPLAILEAMGSGLPVVVWDLPDYRGYDLADGAQAFLVPPFDVEALAERLGRLHDSPELASRLGAAGAALASRFTLRRSIEEHVALYRELHSAEAPPSMGS